MTEMLYPDLVFGRFFDPREQSILTGVEQSRQRVIRARVDLPFERGEPIIMDRKRMMVWGDIMRWAILGEVSAMGIGLEESAHFASSERFEGLIFEDFRRPEGGHLFVVCRPVRGNPKSFAKVSTFGGTNQYSGGEGCAFFGLDFSDLQARVLQRLGTL
ncbi:hypothetical protein [Aquabacter spiritensis]|uniref:Uncharacterized protein n=1 Tax=Aquabacter spiritensis TaxID=933073 RepID=A0A4R3M4V8_9HYPH|nr:hypothetical protein [Aquabacter spiritensis]TCT08300.1 hypothetical protein EDC64_101824 [Aquabacter spiritensis]